MVDQSLRGHIRKTNVCPMKIQQLVPENAIEELLLNFVWSTYVTSLKTENLHHDLPIWALYQHVKPVLLQLSCTKQFV